MSVQLDHTIVAARDREAEAAFLSEVLGLPAPKPVGPFLVVEDDSGVKLDVVQARGGVTTQHYAFRVGEADFDEIFARIWDRSIPYWADPARARPGTVDTSGGGRRVYFEDPSGHYLEIFTQG